MASRLDYYRILQVARTASAAEIKSSYRKLALKYHPDLRSNDSDSKKKDSEDAFKRISAAYDVLGDATRKADYDRNIGNRYADWNPAAVRTTEYHPTGAAHASKAGANQYVPPQYYNVEAWNAWHYGDNAVVRPSVKQHSRVWSVDGSSKHQQYYSRRYGPDGSRRTASFTEEEMEQELTSKHHGSTNSSTSSSSGSSGRGAKAYAASNSSAAENLRMRREQRIQQRDQQQQQQLRPFQSKARDATTTVTAARKDSDPSCAIS